VEDEAMSIPNETDTFTIELPESLLTPFAETPQAFAREVRLAAAIEWYREGRVSQGKGAEIAGMNRWEFLQALSRAQVDVFQVTGDELKEEVERDLQARRELLAPDLPGEARTD
jgi:predicted HTH domain antitoxin